MKANQILTTICMGVAMSSPALAAEDPAPVMRNYFRALAAGNFDQLGELLSDNVKWHQPGNGALSRTYVGKKEVFDLFGKFMKISQGTFKIDHVNSIMSNGNLGTATLHFSASKHNQSISMNGV